MIIVERRHRYTNSISINWDRIEEIVITDFAFNPVTLAGNTVTIAVEAVAQAVNTVARVDREESITDQPSTQEQTKSETKTVNKRTVFHPPKLEEVREFVSENGFSVDAEEFCDHYTENGWKTGGGIQIKDWQATIRKWDRRAKKDRPPNRFNNTRKQGYASSADFSPERSLENASLFS
ncbi:hypothetical protein SH467x_003606 [Pirellulaceae bacterium SH467]